MRFPYIFFIISVIVMISCKSKSVSGGPISKGKSAPEQNLFHIIWKQKEQKNYTTTKNMKRLTV